MALLDTVELTKRFGEVDALGGVDDRRRKKSLSDRAGFRSARLRDNRIGHRGESALPEGGVVVSAVRVGTIADERGTEMDKQQLLKENVGLLGEIVELIDHTGKSSDLVGNRALFQVARQAAVDTLLSIHALISDMEPA